MWRGLVTSTRLTRSVKATAAPKAEMVYWAEVGSGMTFSEANLGVLVSDPDVLELAAFAAEAGGGNPAGVVLDASELSTERMQAIATRVGFPETAFLVDPAVGGDPRQVRIRYFSPGAELPFCGHATIATAVVLAEQHGIGNFAFDTGVGPLVIDTVLGIDGTVTASFTSVEPAGRDLDAATTGILLDLLGLTVGDLDERWPVREAYAGNWHPVVAIREAETFDSFGFDPTPVAALMAKQGWSGTITVVHAVHGAEGLVVEARNLFPVGSITEDPATGSAAAALGGYLREIAAVTPPARFVVHQGRHVGRPSILVVDVPAAGGITVSGTAVLLNSAE